MEENAMESNEVAVTPEVKRELSFGTGVAVGEGVVVGGGVNVGIAICSAPQPDINKLVTKKSAVENLRFTGSSFQHFHHDL